MTHPITHDAKAQRYVVSGHTFSYGGAAQWRALAIAVIVAATLLPVVLAFWLHDAIALTLWGMTVLVIVGCAAVLEGLPRYATPQAACLAARERADLLERADELCAEEAE